MSTDGATRRTAGTSKLKAMIGPMEGLPMARSPATRRSGSPKRAIEMIVPTRDGRRGLTFLSAADAMRCSARTSTPIAISMTAKAVTPPSPEGLPHHKQRN
jgi:hypothetical protein